MMPSQIKTNGHFATLMIRVLVSQETADLTVMLLVNGCLLREQVEDMAGKTGHSA